VERTLVEPQKANKTSRPSLFLFKNNVSFSNIPETALAAAKTQLSRGISLVNEVVVAPDQKRTTMLEATPTTTGWVFGDFEEFRGVLENEICLKSGDFLHFDFIFTQIWGFYGYHLLFEKKIWNLHGILDLETIFSFK
jgi:hypothetical protein